MAVNVRTPLPATPISIVFYSHWRRWGLAAARTDAAAYMVFIAMETKKRASSFRFGRIAAVRAYEGWKRWRIGTSVLRLKPSFKAFGGAQMLFRALVAVLGLIATSAAAEPPKISDPVMFKAFSAARVAGGYMTIDNTAGTADQLIGARIEGRMVMIHQSREVDGVMTMAHVEAVEIAAGDTIAFEPGGFHIMIMGLAPDEFVVGDTVTMTLVFEETGEIPIDFEVTERPAIE
ncbi:MAG: copper chaperone PCu(A)C [Boseongicola sp.]